MLCFLLHEISQRMPLFCSYLHKMFDYTVTGILTTGVDPSQTLQWVQPIQVPISPFPSLSPIIPSFPLLYSSSLGSGTALQAPQLDMGQSLSQLYSWFVSTFQELSWRLQTWESSTQTENPTGIFSVKFW